VDEWTQVTELQTKKISQASARQRMGRAARRGPGLCVRLYSKGEFDSLLPFTPPEIQRSDLTRTYLELLALGVKEVKNFNFTPNS
jgi:HrpA-like RNA helicase